MSGWDARWPGSTLRQLLQQLNKACSPLPKYKTKLNQTNTMLPETEETHSNSLKANPPIEMPNHGTC